MTSHRQKLWRDMVAALSGLVAAAVCIAIVEMAGHKALAGEAAFAVPVVGYALGAGVAAFIAGRFAPHPVRVAIGVTMVLAALATYNFFAMPHPLWFAPAAALALATGCAIGLVFRPNLASITR